MSVMAIKHDGHDGSFVFVREKTLIEGSETEGGGR